MVKAARFSRYAILAALAVLALSVLFTLVNKELEFDESYNLQVPLNLYINGGYQTWYDGVRMFNPEITTGPTVLIPVYLLFELFSSTSHILARLVVYAFFLLLLFIVFRELLAGRRDGRAVVFGGLLAALIFSVPYMDLAPTRVLGEVPGVCCVLLAYSLLASDRPSRHFLSGVFLSLALLAKLIFGLAVVPAIAVAALDRPSGDSSFGRIKRLGLVVSGMSVPAAAWQAYRLASLGAGRYYANIESSLDFFMAKTASHNSDDFNFAYHSLTERLLTMLGHINLGVAGGLALLAAVTLTGALVAHTLIKKRDFNRMYMMVFSYGSLYIIWWIAFNRYDWYRHLFPALLVFIIGLALVLYEVSSRMPHLSKAAFAALALFAVVFVSANHGPYKNLLSDGFMLRPAPRAVYERKLADRLSLMAKDGFLFFGYGWWQSPQVSFLSRTPFYSVYNYRYTALLADRPGLVIIESERWGKLPKHERMLEMFCLIDAPLLMRPGISEVKPFILAKVDRHALNRFFEESWD